MAVDDRLVSRWREKSGADITRIKLLESSVMADENEDIRRLTIEVSLLQGSVSILSKAIQDHERDLNSISLQLTMVVLSFMAFVVITWIKN
jgi:hypothetical protein